MSNQVHTSSSSNTRTRCALTGRENPRVRLYIQDWQRTLYYLVIEEFACNDPISQFSHSQDWIKAFMVLKQITYTHGIGCFHLKMIRLSICYIPQNTELTPLCLLLFRYQYQQDTLVNSKSSTITAPKRS